VSDGKGTKSTPPKVRERTVFPRRIFSLRSSRDGRRRRHAVDDSESFVEEDLLFRVDNRLDLTLDHVPNVQESGPASSDLSPPSGSSFILNRVLVERGDCFREEENKGRVRDVKSKQRRRERTVSEVKRSTDGEVGLESEGE